MKSIKTRLLLWLIILNGGLVLVSAISLCFGPSGIPFRKILLSINDPLSPEYSILFHIRFPRIVLGFAVGGALSLAGVVLQGLFRNPLVEPYTLGISGGAALGIAINILLRLPQVLGPASFPLMGFAGALLVFLLVYSLSYEQGKLPSQQLLLTGVMISFIASSLLMLIMAVSRAENLHGIIFWIMGSLEEPNRGFIILAALVALASLIISYFFSLDLNAFALGEEAALNLGIHTERTKQFLFILASLLTGVTVSITGIIGFVGLVVPHFVRLLVGKDHRVLLISAFLSGSIFLIFCDTIARIIIAPLELPVGVITGILGGSLFIYGVACKKRKPL